MQTQHFRRSCSAVLGVFLAHSALLGGTLMADNPKLASFEFSKVDQVRSDKQAAYEEFLRTPSMHCGIYHLAAGAEDHQSPHTEDELYYVQSGVGKFFADGQDIDVREGTLIYVRKHEKHYFHSIRKDLTLLVVFSTYQGPAIADSTPRDSEP